MTTTTLTTGYVSFASGTYISASNASAVYSAAASIPTLNTAGTLVATGGGSYAISFAGSGTVTNSGSISGPGALSFGPAAGASLSNSGTITSTGSFGGVRLGAGGTVTNATSGVINGVVYAPVGSAAVMLDNAGVINGSGGSLDDAAALEAGGTVTNSGTMTGAVRGIDIRGGAGSVTNTGSIYGGIQYGILTYGIDALITNAGGTIGSPHRAIMLAGTNGVGTVINSGVITGGTASGDRGVVLDAGGVLTNNAGGTITGFYAVSTGSSGVGNVYNYGSIGGSAHAIDLPDGGRFTNGGLVSAPVYSSGAGFFVDNLQGGTVDTTAGNGMYLTGFMPTITNAGSIAAADGNALRMSFGASVTNTGTGAITGAGGGVVISGALGTLTNSGTVAGVTGDGVFFVNGGTVANQATNASIIGGGNGIYIKDVAGTVTNQGTIHASGSNGIYLQAGGSVTNSGLAAEIYGITTGVKGASGTGVTLSNDGTILGGQGDGIDATGVFRNYNGGRILGEINGVVLGAGSTLTNSSLIAALDGIYAVTFSGSGELVIDPGAAFIGVVAGGGGSTLELGATGTAGVLADIGSKYTGFSQANVDSGANWTISSIVAPVAITAGDGSLAVGGAIDAGASFDLDSTGAGETLMLSAVTGGSFANTIGNFSPNNEIVLPGETFAAGDTASFDGLQTLSVLDGGTTVFSFTDLTLQAGGTTATFSVGAHSVTEIACFRARTRIATQAGPVAVEQLGAGDLVLTRGGLRPVRWIGQRRLDCRRHARPQDVLPVRVQAHAFGPDAPHADLYLSPDHAVHLADGGPSGVLIPIRYLLNGASISQIAATEVQYFHVELDAHAILFAEGLACESYLDTGNRSAFANAGAEVQPRGNVGHYWKSAAAG